MKKLLLSALFVLGISANTIAQAVMIDDSNAGVYDGTDVGGIDTLLEVRTKADFLASGLSQVDFELDLINDHATTTYTYNVGDYKTEDVDYYATDTANVYAFGPAELGDFFIVKNSTFWALFQNNVEFDWGVILASVLPEGMNIPSDSMSISHVTATPVTKTVPEPSLMLLMGTGLIGFGLARRKMKC
ncbi:MAG: PEP-CTERM sorting domain-containing protein [Candidatus Thiodiazotropha sp.]